MTAKRDYRVRALNLLKGFSVTLLILLYLSNVIQPEGLHETLHDQAGVEIHSLEAEKDLCHQTLFHRAQAGGCHHQYHFTTLKKCPLCHTVNVADHIISVNSSLTSFRSEIILKQSLNFITVSVSCFPLPSRAPPLC